MVRPGKPEAERRSRTISVRVTTEEAATIAERAAGRNGPDDEGRLHASEGAGAAGPRGAGPMVPKINGLGRSFAGVAAYCLHDAPEPDDRSPETSERVAWTDTRNLPTIQAERAARLMATTAKAAPDLKRLAGGARGGRKLAKPVPHYSLSWAQDETPTRREMSRAVVGSLEALGLEGHEALIVAHDDTRHLMSTWSPPGSILRLGRRRSWATASSGCRAGRRATSGTRAGSGSRGGSRATSGGARARRCFAPYGTGRFTGRALAARAWRAGGRAGRRRRATRIGSTWSPGGVPRRRLGSRSRTGAGWGSGDWRPGRGRNGASCLSSRGRRGIDSTGRAAP